MTAAAYSKETYQARLIGAAAQAQQTSAFQVINKYEIVKRARRAPQSRRCALRRIVSLAPSNLISSAARHSTQQNLAKQHS